ncbi:MAG: polyprenyl synthetase family protein [Tissierellia bacterium]|nr:polyprenyl synthetase family protein [Tissierellia bacterium]
MLIEQWLFNKTKKVESYLNEIVEVKNNPQKMLYESMNYSLLSGGKRLRPILMIGAYEIFDNNIEKVMPFACAMEMIHTYSLIHDDLPAMDDDDYRRGRLSNHKMFNEATAILAGDALLNKAFEVALETIEKYDLDVKRAAKALSVIGKSSGTEGMIGGQIVDINGKFNNIDELKYMYSLKTGAIIKSSVVAGAILGGAKEEEIFFLEKYAELLGLAFQIEDDILDIIGTQEKLGKPIGSDVANEKITYLSFIDIEEAKKHVQQYTDEAIDNLNIFAGKGIYLSELAKYLTNRDH